MSWLIIFSWIQFGLNIIYNVEVIRLFSSVHMLKNFTFICRSWRSNYINKQNIANMKQDFYLAIIFAPVVEARNKAIEFMNCPLPVFSIEYFRYAVLHSNGILIK